MLIRQTACKAIGRFGGSSMKLVVGCITTMPFLSSTQSMSEVREDESDGLAEEAGAALAAVPFCAREVRLRTGGKRLWACMRALIFSMCVQCMRLWASSLCSAAVPCSSKLMYLASDPPVFEPMLWGFAPAALSDSARFLAPSPAPHTQVGRVIFTAAQQQEGN